MRRVLVRYRVKPELVEENERLVREVYVELARTEPDGLRYATFKLDDGVTFVHLAVQGDDNPLPRTEAFQRFVENIRERCDEPPVTAVLEELGSYRFGELVTDPAP
jgi:hypothetical protein